jgi:hypothetical protein
MDQPIAETATCQKLTLTTVIHRTPLDKGSARRKDRYLPKHNTHNRQTFIELLWTRDQPVAETATCYNITQQTDIPLDKGSARHRDHYLAKHNNHKTDLHSNTQCQQSSAHLRFRPRGYRDLTRTHLRSQNGKWITHVTPPPLHGATAPSRPSPT